MIEEVEEKKMKLEEVSKALEMEVSMFIKEGEKLKWE